MIVYDKEQKQIVIPNGLGNVNIVINQGCDDEAIKVHRAADLLNEFNTNIDVLEFGRNYYVGGEITEIREVNTEYGNATYFLDNRFQVFRGKWFEGNSFNSEDQIKVGAYIVVYGVLNNYDGRLELDRDSQVIAYQECTSGEGGDDKPTPPQDGWGMTGVFNNWGATPDIPFNENGEWEGRPYKVIRNFEATGGEFKIRRNNDSTDSYTANFYDIPQFALLHKNDFNMSIDDGVWDIYLFFGNDGVPKEMLILNPGTDLSTIKYEYTLTILTDKENAIIEIGDGYTDLTDVYYGSATVPMKYGCSYSIGIYMEGYDDIYEELACRNDEERTYTLTKSEGGEGGSCNLISPIVFSKDAGNTIKAENVQIPTFVYEGNQYYNVDFLNLADKQEFKIHILFKPNNRGDSEPINVFGCEDTDWDGTAFGARIYQGRIHFAMSGYYQDIPYTENTWYNVEMGYNTTKLWFIVNGETLLETEHTSLNRPSQTLMIGAINNGGNAFRPFYGKIAAIYAEADGNQIYLLPKEDGTMGAYWNNKNNIWISISGNNNARFENDNISGDGMKSITWLGNLEDKWVTPSMNDRDDNNLIVVSPSEGYSGLKRTVINPQTIYNEGLEAGRAEGGEGGSCNLVSRTFTSNGVYHPEPEQMQTIWFTVDKPSAYDTGIKLVDDSWVEIYFRATEGGDTPTLIGCEDSDWSNTTFATRWFDNNLGVKIGVDEISIPYTAGDDKLHKLKFGKTVGVWFDDVKVQDIAGEEWTPTDRTIYIGAMNDPSNNNEKGFWRYWVGYIGDVTVYGSLNENVREYHFKAGDYGKGGEFKRVEDDTNLPNLGGDGMATVQTGSYGEAPDGYNEITINVPQYNLGTLDWTLTSPSTEVKNAFDDGYDGYNQVIVRPENVIAQEKENAINDFKNKMDEITITKNGTYSTDDQETLHSIAFDGNSYFNTGIVPTENIKIEACIKITNGNDNGAGGIIIGGGIDPVDLANSNSTENRGIAIGMGGGAIYGIWGAKKSANEPYKYEGEGTTTVTLQKTNDSWGWDGEKGSFGASTLYIGGYNRNGEEVEEKFLQSIVYIKIWTNKDDDSTMTLFQPKNMAQGGFGLVNSEGVENSHIENLGSGTATFVEENVKKYPYGFKRVEVNVVPQISVEEEGLNVWYNHLKRIIDENDVINSDFEQTLVGRKGDTMQNVFPGISMTISGQAVAKPFFIYGFDKIENKTTKIGKLVSGQYGTPKSCPVVIIGSFDCKNIQNVDIEAFKYMTDLCYIYGMNGLGESFISPQTINFTYCTNLFIKANNKKVISNFAESLFDLSKGNKNGLNTSTLKFKSAVQERSENADAIALMRSKGWTVEFANSDL